MRYLLVMNPGSRGGSSSKRFKEIFSKLDKAKVQYEYRITTSLEDAYNISREGNLAGYDVIVAVGGDGTLNRVLNGFYDEHGHRNSKSKMGVIYTGTSPDFCKSYDIPTNIDAAVEVLLKGQSRKIQIGKINLASEFNPSWDGFAPEEVGDIKTRYFACCANIGIGAALARNANSGIRKIAGDIPGTFLALLKTLAAYKASDFTIIADKQKDMLKQVHSISIGRSYYIASGIKIQSDLASGDGRFYKLTVSNMRLWDLFGVLKRMYSGKPVKNDGVIDLSYGKVIEIYGNSANPEVEFDGDPAGFLPCRIEMAAGELDVIYSATPL